MLDGGQRIPLDMDHLKGLIISACQNLGDDVKPDPIMAETMRNLYDGVPMDEVYKASILAARTLIEKDPDYTYATARLLLHTIFKEVLGRDLPQNDEREEYMRATLAYRDGTWVATPFPNQDSSMLVPLAAADCLLVRERHAPAAKAGAPCQFVKLDD